MISFSIAVIYALIGGNLIRMYNQSLLMSVFRSLVGKYGDTGMVSAVTKALATSKSAEAASRDTDL